jgi:uncharacterized protein YgiB involved in biofilm formation
MKRSRMVALTLMSSSAFSLQACDNDDVDAQVYRDLQNCIELGDLTEVQCREVYQVAVREHVQTAPRFDSAEQCTQDYGQDQCQQVSGGGGSFWMPLMMGYFAARAFGSGANVQPLYPSPGDPGSLRTADNRKVPAHFGRTKLPTWATTPLRTRTQTMGRGGFGSSRSTSGTFGG